MNTMKSALCAAFAVLASVASAEVLPQLPTFYTWVKNPNAAKNGIMSRGGYVDTGVPAKSGIEVEADIQCDSTLFKNSYNKGLTGYESNKLIMPLCFNPGTAVTADSCLCFGYGPETDATTFKGGSLQTGETPFMLTTTGRYQVHVRLCAGEQWLDAKKNGDADFIRVITSSIPESYDTGTTLKLFGYKLTTSATDLTKWRSAHAAPYIIYSMKIYTVEGIGSSAVRTLVRDFAACEAENEEGQTVPALYDFVQGKVYFNENKQIDSNGNVAGLVRSTEEVTRSDVLMISSEPEICAPVSPAIGAKSGLTADYAEAFVAPEGVVQVNESTKAICTGWKLYEYNGETKTWDLKNESASRTCDYSHADAANVRRLVWQWNEVTTYAVSATTEEPGAVVTASKTQASPGEVVTFSAVAPANRVFWKWTGDVPEEHVYDASFSMPITQVTELVAVFADRVAVAPGGDVQAALDGVTEGAVVELAEGDYLITSPMTVSGGRRLYGAGRDKTRLVLNASVTDQNWIISLSDAKSVVTGVTVTATEKTSDYLCKGGLRMTGGAFTDGRITGLYSKQGTQGGGVNMTDGLLLRTEVTDCFVFSSGGSLAGPGGVYMTGGVVADCAILRNEVDNSSHLAGHGAGLKITGGMVTNTLIAWNHDVNRTSGVAATGGVVADCTIVSNRSSSTDRWGGVYNDGATFVGCTIGGNTCYGDKVVYNVRKGASGTFTDCTIVDDLHPGTPTVVEVDSVEAFMAAIGSACDGSVITLAPGDYTLSQTVYLTNAVTVVGRGEVNVTAGRSVRAFFLRNPSAELRNLTIRDCSATAVTMLDGGKVSGCTFTGNHASSGSGGALRMAVSGTVEASRFVKNGLTNSGRDDCGGAVDYEGRDGVLDRCQFVSNSIAFTRLESSRFPMGSALHVMGTMRIRSCLFARNYYDNSQGAGAIMFENTDKWTSGSEYSQLENCTIADNSTAVPRVSDSFYADTTAGVALNDDARVTGVNCIIDGNVDYAGAVSNVYVRSGCVFNLTYSDVDAGSSVAGGEGNISEDPLFKNRTANNYRLAADSPCVNTGTNADWMATAVDLRGKPRIAEGIVDMGAYEWQDAGLLLLFR